ncbi:MAG: Gfo/Idh/MocA family oxidoreductase [Verrucomicrobiota bacterium]|nr:Gfo/Idh/MocA family oxidoreductase [Verrucomicrobiota bacterium]
MNPQLYQKLKTSRRKFLQSTALATGPFILPSHIWAAKTKPNDKLVMGFIGMGKQNGGLLRNFMGQGVQAVAVCDVDSNRRKNAENIVNNHNKNSDCRAVIDFREITEDQGIDAVCIATPDHWHSVITISALNNKKDVYCEKPLTHNIHESVEVIKAVNKNNRVLQTGSMQRSSSEFRIACELVRNGVIGKVHNVDISVGDPGRPCDLQEEKMEPGLDWDLWCGPGPLRGYSSVLSPRGIHNHFPAWRNYMEYGGGMVTDWGAHHIDIAQWGLGTDDSGPIEAKPPQDWKKSKSKRGAQLVYSNGSTVTHKNGFGVHFQGADGEVKVNRGRFAFTYKGKEISKFERRGDGSLGSALQKAEKSFLNNAKIKLYKSNHHIRDFLACVESRKKPITNEIVGARSAICCHLMNQAYYNGEIIKWDPKNNTFADKSGNPKWLTRDYRGQWKV